MSNLLKRLTRILREEGVGGLLRKAGRKIYSRRVMVFFERSLDIEPTTPFLPRSPLTVRFAEREDLHLFDEHVDAERLARYHRRLKAGHMVLGVFSADEKQFVGWAWTTDQTLDEPYDRATYLAQRDLALHFDGEVVPDLRGRGVAFVAFPLIWDHWRRRGKRAVHCTIDATNKASIKLHKRLGYEERDSLTVHKILGFRWMTSDSPRVQKLRRIPYV